MPGLINSEEGLCYATGGLIFEPGLGGPGGLSNPTAIIPLIRLAGTGGLRASTKQGLAGPAVFSGAGALSALPSGRYVTNPASFAGSGSLSALPSGRYATNPARFSGAGSLSAAASMALLALGAFAGKGGI